MGYSVVAITDHERLVSHFDLSDENIIFITAYEMYIRDLPFDHVNDIQAHINFYSETPTNKLLYYTPKITKYIPESERATLQYHKLVEEREYSVDFIRKTIEYAKENGFLACHNHPTWSFEDESIAPAYDGCFAMEIYNHGSYQEGHDEYNRHYYDYQLNRGLDMALVASDDNHNPLGDEYKDAFGGATYILADKLEYGEIKKT